MNDKVKVAIIGPGNIGTDLMIKVMRNSRNLEMGAMVGVDPNSDGLARAARLGVATTAEGIEGLLKLVDRMVLNMHSHPFFFRVVTGAFWYSPGQKDTIELKTEVIMQPARPVLLHDEPKVSSAAVRGRSSWFRRDSEIPLPAVAGQGRSRSVGARGHCVTRACRLLLQRYCRV